MRSRIGVGLLAGALGGLLGWFLQEMLINYNDLVTNVGGVGCHTVTGPVADRAAVVSILCVCGFIGVFLGAVDGIVDANPRKIIIGMAIGIVGGIVIGGMGNSLGGRAYVILGGNNSVIENPSAFSYTLQIIARVAQVGLWGLGIGTGVALATLNPKRIMYGAIGGLLGGMLTGFVFDLVSASTLPVNSALSTARCIDTGNIGRAVCFTGIGALTGLFIGLVEELMKQAWVKVLAGRNEGKDFILYKAMNLLGRDERCDVPLFGDNSVGVQHAAIRADGRRHFLLAATPTGTLVNGQAVVPQSEVLLRDGDMIQIGSHRILFHEKATASRLAKPNADDTMKPARPGAVPIPSHLCSFCGAPKDASGNCRCSLGAPGAPALNAEVIPTSASQPAFADPYAPMAPAYSPAPMASDWTAVQYAPAIGNLVGIEGPYAGQVFALNGSNTVVGREPDKDIVLSSDTTISRGHAQLALGPDGVVVTDLGSSNGTYVNGQRIYAPMPIVPGDVVQFGSSKFTYQ